MFTHTSNNISTTLADQATHAADQVVKSSQQLAHGVVDGVRETSHELRVKAARASDDMAHYVRHEPVKAMLIAAATGATLMALVSLISRTRSHH